MSTAYKLATLTQDAACGLLLEKKGIEMGSNLMCALGLLVGSAIFQQRVFKRTWKDALGIGLVAAIVFFIGKTAYDLFFL